MKTKTIAIGGALVRLPSIAEWLAGAALLFGVPALIQFAAVAAGY